MSEADLGEARLNITKGELHSRAGVFYRVESGETGIITDSLRYVVNYISRLPHEVLASPPKFSGTDKVDEFALELSRTGLVRMDDLVGEDARKEYGFKALRRELALQAKVFAVPELELEFVPVTLLDRLRDAIERAPIAPSLQRL